MRRHLWTALVLVAVTLALLPRLAGADSHWLDGDLHSWNTPHAAVPAAPRQASVGVSYCESSVRPPETAEDTQVAARGWLLYAPYQRGWHVSIVQGTLGFDANCRPVNYQVFVFLDGTFAGTLSPEPMLPRSDGALVEFGFGPEGLSALYDRYTPADALCCPSAQTRVSFTTAQTPAGPVLNPMQAKDLLATPVGG
jgi:hypothetical protein